MKIGIIGGSGLYDMEGLTDVHTQKVKTPFGEPSDEYCCARMDGREVVFLPRHGKGHRIMPSEINHRANIFGMKLLGVERIISISAVGSLREELRPRDLVLPDQYFDRTKQSQAHTFFGQGVVAHVSFAEPACPALRAHIAAVAREGAAIARSGRDIRVRIGGTYVNMEGPAFSTKAESQVYRGLGFDVIGMTSLAEAKLCKEAEICYQAVAMVTDYDCWHESEGPVTVELLIGHLLANVQVAKDLLKEIVAQMPAKRSCGCDHALSNAIITKPEYVTEEAKRRLEPIIGKYV